MISNRRRNFLHLLSWWVVVPWAASAGWFWLDGLLRSREFNVGMVIGVIPFAMAYGLLGMLMCLVVTFPLYLLSAVLFNRHPQIIASISFRRSFVVLSALIGLGSAAFGNKLLNTGRVEYLLLGVGMLAGTLLALVTLKIWNSAKAFPPNQK